MGQQTIYQRQAGDMSEETSPGQYNVYMGAGRVQTDSSTATEVYIDKDIGFIRTPVTRNSKLVETVMGGMAYSTEGRYPKYIHGSDRYDTGSFTALLGSISGTHKLEASAYYIERWNEFISQKGLFLLKTDSGDVKIIAITGNPARQYGTSLEEIGITRVTYSWTEMANIDEVVVT